MGKRIDWPTGLREAGLPMIGTDYTLIYHSGQAKSEAPEGGPGLNLQYLPPFPREAAFRFSAPSFSFVLRRADLKLLKKDLELMADLFCK